MEDSPLAAQLAALGPWYHTIDLGNGVSTPGRSNVANKFRRLAPHLPGPLENLRVLDLGCNAGGLSVEFARRGAQVVGIEANKTFARQAEWVRNYLSLDRFQPHHMVVYDIDHLDGGFDIILFMGLIYHLRHPQLALDLVHGLCRGMVFINTPRIVTDARAMELRIPDRNEYDQADEQLFNWWFPSSGALASMVRAAGFVDVTEIESSTKAFVSSAAHVDNSSAFRTGTVFLKARTRS